MGGGKKKESGDFVVMNGYDILAQVMDNMWIVMCIIGTFSDQFHIYCVEDE